MNQHVQPFNHGRAQHQTDQTATTQRGRRDHAIGSRSQQFWLVILANRTGSNKQMFVDRPRRQRNKHIDCIGATTHDQGASAFDADGVQHAVFRSVAPIGQNTTFGERGDFGLADFHHHKRALFALQFVDDLLPDAPIATHNDVIFQAADLMCHSSLRPHPKLTFNRQLSHNPNQIVQRAYARHNQQHRDDLAQHRRRLIHAKAQRRHNENGGIKRLEKRPAFGEHKANCAD